MADVLFIAGIVAVVVATGALAGIWWGVLLLGVLLVALGWLTRRAELAASRPVAPAPVEPEADR